MRIFKSHSKDDSLAKYRTVSLVSQFLGPGGQSWHWGRVRSLYNRAWLCVTRRWRWEASGTSCCSGKPLNPPPTPVGCKPYCVSSNHHRMAHIAGRKKARWGRGGEKIQISFSVFYLETQGWSVAPVAHFLCEVLAASTHNDFLFLRSLYTFVSSTEDR